MLLEFPGQKLVIILKRQVCQLLKKNSCRFLHRNRKNRRLLVLVLPKFVIFAEILAENKQESGSVIPFLVTEQRLGWTLKRQWLPL